MIGNLNRNDIASIRRANMTLDTFKKKLKKNQEKMAAIDEEFRQKAEKKKAALVQDCTQIENTITFWSNSTVQLYGKPVEELMEMILTEEEPPLILHNKETGEDYPNPEAVATAEKDEEPLASSEAVQEEQEETVSESENETSVEDATDDNDVPTLEDTEEENFSDEEDEEEDFSDPEENEEWPSDFGDFKDEWK